MGYGVGPSMPLRRVGGDFVTVSGTEVVAQALAQILGTTNDGPNTVGEICWDTKLGSQLAVLKHKSDPVLLNELGSHYVVDSIRQFEPRVVVRRASIEKNEITRKLIITVFYKLNRGTPEAPILSDDKNVSVSINL